MNSDFPLPPQVSPTGNIRVQSKSSTTSDRQQPGQSLICPLYHHSTTLNTGIILSSWQIKRQEWKICKIFLEKQAESAVNLPSKVFDSTSSTRVPGLLCTLLAMLQFFAGKHSTYADVALKKFAGVPELYAFLMLAQPLESEKVSWKLHYDNFFFFPLQR